jgi:hypothetical protein
MRPFVPAVQFNFDGIGNGVRGFVASVAPSDANGSVGPNHYVQIVNTDLEVFSKSGSSILGPVPVNTLWNGFGGNCQTHNDGDPVVLYDSIADRWVISQFAITGADGAAVPFLECVAVSQTPDPTGAYNRYSFPYSTFNDYPKMGVWPDAYYETFNMFNSLGTSFVGAEVCAYDRAKMLAGFAATQQCFNLGASFGGLLPSDLTGATLPPSGSPNYLLSLGPNVTDMTLDLWKFHVDWAAPGNTILTGPTAINVDPYTLACNGGGTCIPQGGTPQQLDSLGDRLMFRLSYRNFGTHESLLANHSIMNGSNVGVRWYEIRSPGTNPTVFQQGILAPDTNFRWMGSIGMDQAGDIALGYSVSGPMTHPGIAFAGRLATDPLGQMAQGEDQFFIGQASQTGGLSRWGDYSSISVDPSDNCTFWYTNQYIPTNGEFNWKTRVASFKFANCASNDFALASLGTISAAQGTAGSTTISTTLIRGVAESLDLSISGLPSGASASFNPNPISAGSSSVLTVNTGTAATGDYTLTVVATGTSAMHSTTAPLTVTAAASNTSTTLTAPTSAVFGQTVTFTAMVSSASGGQPTGSVSFMDGATTFGTASIDSLGKASVTAAFNAGSHSVRAVYGGDSNFAGSTSSVVIVTVKQATSTTSLSSSMKASFVGQNVTFTGTVFTQFGGQATGQVTFKDGTSLLGTGVLNSSNQATFSTSALAIGSHNITAVYGADANVGGSTSPVLTQRVSKFTTTTKVSSSANPSHIGDKITITASITAPGGNIPDGETITFKFGTAILGTAVTVGGSASIAVSTLPVGSDTVFALYPGDKANLSSSGTLAQKVNKFTTTTVVTSSLNPSKVGNKVTFKGVVTPAIPDGETLTFKFGATLLGTATTSGGSASITVSTLPAGSDTVNVSYPGDATFAASLGTILQKVNKVTTTTSLTSSLNPSHPGDSVTFKALVTPASGTIPDGQTITFRLGTKILGSSSTSGGIANFTTSALPTGSETITASYPGDANNVASSGSVVQQVK